MAKTSEVKAIMHSKDTNVIFVPRLTVSKVMASIWPVVAMAKRILPILDFSGMFFGYSARRFVWTTNMLDQETVDWHDDQLFSEGGLEINIVIEAVGYILNLKPSMCTTQPNIFFVLLLDHVSFHSIIASSGRAA